MSWREEVYGLGQELLKQLETKSKGSSTSVQLVRCVRDCPEPGENLVLAADLAREIDDAQRDTRLEISIRTRLRGVGIENQLEISCNTSAERVGQILCGFVLSVATPAAKDFRDESCDDNNGGRNKKTFTPEIKDVVHQFKVGDVTFCQPTSLRQWHPNACGFHALFNAMQLIQPYPHRSRLDELFWCETLRWLRALYDYNRVAQLWSTSGIQSVTMDQAQMQFLVDNDVRLCGKIGVYGSLEELLAKGDKIPRAIVFGCVTHWAAAALNPESKILYFAESFDKTCLQFTEAHSACDESLEVLAGTAKFPDPRGLANSIMEDYHPKFLAKLRAAHIIYQHMPNEMLEGFYESGVPEYWKGCVKNSLYWTHRPRELRVFLLIQEIEAVVAIFNHLYKLVTDGGLFSTDSPAPFVPEAVDNSLSDLRTWCDQQPERSFQSDALKPGFLRRDEEWDPNSEEYKSGRSVEHRKKPPPPEVYGDIFDRQRVMVDFDQGLVNRQVCLVVGTGGVGQNTALTLARLGVGCIILLDYDKVDASNLTRQCLSSRDDIGKSKVDVARLNLLKQHNLRSTILTLDGDILENWPTVVELARMSTVIFNCADVGVMFDCCMASLAKELCIPVATGQSFAWKFMTEVYSGQPQEACPFCQETTKSSFGLRNIADIMERWNCFQDTEGALPNDSLSSIMCEFLRCDRQFRMWGPTTRKIVTSSLDDVDAKAVTDLNNKSRFEAFLECVHSRVMDLLLPGKISERSDLRFIPRPVLPETRFFGSWVCPCLASGTMMVSHWLNLLTGPTAKNPPTNVVFNLDEGMTSEEQMSYEIGMGLTKEDRLFVHSPSNSACELCREALILHSRADLFFGSSPTWLKPTAGRIFSVPHFVPDSYASSEDHASVIIHNEGGIEPRVLVEPRMPAHAHCMFASSSEKSVFAPGALTTLPMIKCTELEALQEPSALKCSASGVRSAIVRLNNRAYRIKGCGNNEDGFTIETRGDHGEETVRGCLFADTSRTEMRMSELVHEVLTPYGVRAGNVPVCFYRYYTPGLPEEVACFGNVYETLGDRRLGDHVLAGIELLIPMMCAHMGEDTIPILQRRISEARGMHDEVWETATIAECGLPVQDLRGLVKLQEKVPGIRYSLHPLWAPTVRDLESALEEISEDETANGSILLQLAFVLGWQCGVTCYALAAAGLSWGTYPDDTGVHCNSHANNMVILDAPLEQDVLLAPVDFDMSFEKSAFDPTILDQAHQKLFPRDWENLITLEQRKL